MNKPVIIIGGIGHGSVIAACINDNRKRFQDTEWEVKGFCNDYDSEVDGYPVLGKLCDIPKLVEQNYYFAWAIHLIGRSPKTAELFNSINIPDDKWATIIHKTAFVSDSVVIESGVSVMANAYIAPRTLIGKCTMVKANTNIGHDVEIAPLCHIAMGSNIVSFAHLGYCSNVAVGSTVLAHCKIGKYAMAGAASLVSHNIPDYEIHAGVPAKYLKKIQMD